MKRLYKTASEFLSGVILEIKPLSGGHIHQTFLVKEKTSQGRRSLVLQRVNHLVFTDPPGIIDNMLKVIQQINQNLELSDNFEVFKLIPTRSGPYLFNDEEGYSWRMLTFIEGSYSLDHVQDPEHAYQGALTYGKFLALIADMDANELVDTIPNFHHLGYRYETFKAVSSENKVGRLHRVQKEVDFVEQRIPFINKIVTLIEGGSLPLRVVHNDTKLSNVLFSEESHQGISVVDWDTIMPGYLMYDFGDMVRTFSSPVAEDSLDLDAVSVQMPVFQSLCAGFLHDIYSVITDSEVESLLPGARLMTFIMGLRFLTDYLQGDVYYNIEHDKHNLDRCRNQFCLMESLEKNDNQLREILRQALASYKGS
ncbi:MAG: phosphotransferase enzyme family protein [Cyclobacteriaceae bacterium]